MSDIKQTLLSGAHIYYDYLCNNNLGLSEIPIKHYEYNQNNLILTLKNNVIDVDLKLSGALFLCIEEKFYSIAEESEFELQFYDEKQKILYLAPNEAMKNVVKNAQEKKLSLTLSSDLKFLVQNVADFFESYGDRVSLPTHITQTLLPPINRLSEEQNRALFVVLNTPLSYVWGPPGTGKTQAVLFEALLYYIKENKRVAVVSTTNNALEQVLKTLIRQFDVLGLERNVILRLGTPTLEYMNAYPQTCDPSFLKQGKEASLFDFQDTLKSRLKSSSVVGVTLDGFIKRYESLDLKFAHIFLDECAYAPLIKTCALCVDNTPIALFGDHKQIPPVCEMPKHEITKPGNQDAYVWNLSALFLESFCRGENLYKLAQMSEEGCNMPPLKDVALSKLSQTYRYGDNLAKILDKYIYQMGLIGIDRQMELFVCDSGIKHEEDTHISENEARMCERLCHQLSTQDYALITPFVKQKKRLMQRLAKEKVFTIHGSQGQEFDNVIFSPVSLHHYLTNSQQTNALYALNVAISRAKKRLFIVCDYSFWSKQKGQLIWALLQESKLINI